MTQLCFILLVLFAASVLSIDRFRRLYVNETVSTRVVLRCPLALSDEDTIEFYQYKDSGNAIKLNIGSESLDSFLLDILPESRSDHYQCRVKHRSGKSNMVDYYIDRKGEFKDIQKLKYSTSKTRIIVAKLGDSIGIKCPIEGKGPNSHIWFGPDLLQLNITKDGLNIESLGSTDFGEYFCGRLESIKDLVLIVGKIVVKLATLNYDPSIKKAAKLLSYPTYKLGERVLYQPPTAYTLTRRLIWEYPPETVLINQGRDFNKETFTHDMTQDEFYYRASDRVDISYSAARRVLFQTEKMGKKIFEVEIYPNPATVIIGQSLEITCNNSNNLKATWHYKNPSTLGLQNLPGGVSVRVEETNTIIRINSSEPLHSGTYVCDAKKGTADVKVIVAPLPKLSVSPIEVVIRPGTSARFLCQLLDATGKVIWRRKDKKSFQMNVETRIGGDTQAILAIDFAPKELNGSIYECAHNDMVAESLLMVKDICPQGQRACNDGNCIEESLFCNGVKDCSDFSDEDITVCAHCEPNQLACNTVNDDKPLQKCVLKHWFCDGDNDCGNGFDELNCPKINKDTCISTHFACNDNHTLIPRSLWCDKITNCPQGDDEINCRPPQIIAPNKESTYVVHTNTSISLLCEVVSVPTSSINWRYNWGNLPQRLNFTITETGTDCNRIRNILTIHNMDRDFAGVYTCEAVSVARAMGKDYTIFVTSELLCNRPYFNNAAWLKDMCLRCFCSNVTDNCTSAKGFYQSPSPRLSSHTRAYLMNYLSKGIMETEENKALYDPVGASYRFYNETYSSFVVNDNLYLASDFGLAGSWLESYSYYVTVRFMVTGSPYIDIKGPILIIKSKSGKSLHWCRSDNSQVIYATETGFLNSLKVSLWEKENWYNNIECSESSTREDVLHILSDVSHLLIRIKYYTDQVGFEFHNATLEYTIPAVSVNEAGVLAPRIEMCNCPFPYSGLSCEKCIDGYRRNKNNECVRKCPSNCDQCDSTGNCVMCKGHRTGSQCLQCKRGYTRAVDKNMMENCVECQCEGHENMTMIANDCTRDISISGLIQCRCTGKEINDDTCNLCLRKPLMLTDEKKCENRTKSENSKCNKHGTDFIVDKQCKCKMSYGGKHCEKCKPGYFQYDNRCLKCFCSNSSGICKASSEYKFVNLTLNSNDFQLDVKVTNRLLSGVYDVDTKVGYLKVNRTKDEIVVKHNQNGRGPVYITVTVNDTSNSKNINTYTMIYGGKITMQLDYITDKLEDLYIGDVTPFLEIESKKFERLWVPFKYNDEHGVFESLLSEYSSPGWRSERGDLVTRESLLRSLMTAQHLSIGINFNNDIVKKIRIRKLKLEHAIQSSGIYNLAPVEVCPCVSEKSGIKCEACNQVGLSSVLSLSPGMPDYKCGQCTGPACKTCSLGSYKYDFLLNKHFSTCQPGIEITTKGRVIKVNRGESITIPCQVKSYKGNVALHKWSKKDSDIELKTFRQLNDNGQSNSILILENVQLSDSGYYTCAARNALSNGSEEFYVMVIDEPARFNVSVAVITETKDNIVYNVSVVPRKGYPKYKIIWSVVKDGKEVTGDLFKIKVSEEKNQYKVDLQIKTNLTDGYKLRGLVIGTGVDNPFVYEIIQNIQPNISIGIDEIKIGVDKSALNLKFLESGSIKVVTWPNVKTEIVWYKVLDNGTEYPLPDGVTGQGNELVIWSGSENHRGKYVGYVTNSANKKFLGKVHTVVTVSPMGPHVTVDMVNIKGATNISARVYVPSKSYCPDQRWYLHDSKSGTVTDITVDVTRVSDEEVIIYYPLKIGNIVKFKCSVIPEAKLTGEIVISFESKYPIIELIPNYKTSMYPITLQCVDRNTALPSNITWLFNDKPIGNDSIIDWSVLGGFSPVIHEGKYTCHASNAHNNVTKSINMPELRSGKHSGYIKIRSATNPIAIENGTMKIYVTDNQRFQVSAVLVGIPPLGTTIQWSHNNKTISSTKSGNYYSSLEISSPLTDNHYGTYRVQVVLSNGTVMSSEFEVLPQRTLEYYVKIEGLNSSGDLSIYEGDNSVIGCKLMRRVNGIERDMGEAITDWVFIDSIGGTMSASDIKELRASKDSRTVDISNARKDLNKYRGQCVVKYGGEVYRSKYFSFDVNQRNINVRVRLLGLAENRYVVNDEGATSQIICQAYDDKSQRILKNGEYKWILKYNTDDKKTNWRKMFKHKDTITFGGLIYRTDAESAVGQCRVNYFGNIMFSNEFTFRVTKKSSKEYLPVITIDATYDPNRPPYPTRVVCRDSRTNSTANITVTVTNPNFQKNIITTDPGSMIIDFSANGTTFDPYKYSGLYTFTVTNEHGSVTKQILLPQYKNQNWNYSANVVIQSTKGQIENGRLRIKSKSDVKLICAYYGHPYPVSMKWSSRDNDLSNTVTESSDYWTTIEITDFDHKRNGGEYECNVHNHQRRMTKKIVVEGYAHGMKVEIIEVGGASMSSEKTVKQGTKVVMKSRVTDLFTNSEIKNATGFWEYRLSGTGNFTEIKSSSFPKQQINVEGNTMTIVDVIRVGSVEIRYRFENKTDRFLSEIVTVHVQENSQLHPEPHFLVVYKNNSIYPTKLSCIDTSEAPSDVVITKIKGRYNKEVKYSSISKKGNAEWIQRPFSPYYDAGTYQCLANGRYQNRTIFIDLPEEQDKIHETFVKFESRINEITIKEKTKTLNIVNGSKFMIICNYYGSVGPITDVEIVLESKSGEAQAPSMFATSFSTTLYYGEINIDHFDTLKHSGTYTCRSRNRTHNLIDTVMVQGVKQGVEVLVKGLDSDSTLKLTLGSTRTFECSVVDVVTKKPIKDVKYDWKLETDKGESYDIDNLSETIKRKYGSITLDSVNAMEHLRGKCEAITENGTFYSNFIEITVAEDEAKKPKLQFIEIPGTGEHGLPFSLKCIDERSNVSRVNITQLSGLSLKVKHKVERNSAELLFPKKISNPLLYVGSYRCEGYNKFGHDWKIIEVAYKPKSKPLMVSIESKDVHISQGIHSKIVDTSVGKRIELDCIFSGDNHPIVGSWILNQNSEVTKLAIDEVYKGFSIYEKRSDCLSLVHEGFLNKSMFNLNCTATDSKGTVKTDLVKINIAVVGTKIVISGLETDGETSIKQDSERTLTCKVLDLKTEADISKKFTIAWQFMDEQGQIYELNQLAGKVVHENGILKLSALKNPEKTLSGHCFVNNGTHNFTSTKFKYSVKQDEEKSPTIKLTTSWEKDREVPRSLKCVVSNSNEAEITVSKADGGKIPEEWIKRHKGSLELTFPVKKSNEQEAVGTYICRAVNKYGWATSSLTISKRELLSVALNSTINKIDVDRQGNLSITVRKNRKLELNCYATGDPTPAVKMYIITEGYRPDLPVPSRKIELAAGDPNTPYQVTAVSNKHYQLSRLYYSQSPPSSFSCEATIGNKTVSRQVKVIEVLDILKVNLISFQQNQLNQVAFLGKPFKIGCEMRDNDNMIVKINSIHWQFRDQTYRDVDLNKLAKVVTNKDNMLTLDDINMTYGSLIRGRCIANYNTTYDTWSDEFNLNIKESPKIKRMFVELTDSDTKYQLQFPVNYTYDARNTTEFECKTETSDSIKPTTKWVKCADDSCNTTESVGAGNSLILYEDSTKFSDVGEYRCVVKLEIDNNLISEMVGVIHLKRKGAPKQYPKQPVESRHSVTLTCDNSYSSPEGNVTWSFVPRGKTMEESVPKTVHIKTEHQISILTMNKPLMSEYSGTYICRTVNEYGSGGRTFVVKVLGSIKRRFS